MNKWSKENETLFHLIYLGILTVFGVMLSIVGTMAGGEDIFVCIEVVIILLAWITHIVQIGSPIQRIYFYTLAAALFIMYYGSHIDSLTDMPLVLCLMLIILSFQEDMGLIYLISISYPLMILHHIFVTGYVRLDMDWIVLSRIVLGVVCVLIAVFMARFFIRSNERKRREKRELEEGLLQSRKDNENLLANVSHELRTPINAINGISDILLREELNPVTRNQVSDIHAAGHRIYRQVTSILDYSEIMTNNLRVNAQDYSIKELMDVCMENLLENGNPKKLNIVTEISDELPEYLHGDQEKIYRVIILLLENAYKFTNSGSIELYFGGRHELYGMNFSIDIYDTGVGMSQGLVERLFEGAFKADANSTRVTSGLGIGFTVANELAQVMDGFITVESEEGEGTHVHITIPQKYASADVTAESKEISHISAFEYQVEQEGIAFPNLRVLIVDDEPLNIKVVRGILRTFQIEAKYAETGSEAVALCELEDYDLIFMDYMMPEMDGEEAMYRIRSVRSGYYQKTPIVALTANAASGARQMFLDMGFDEFLPKPVDLSAMERLLKKITGGEKHE